MLTLDVAGMTCEHCVRAVTGAVKTVPGAGKVVVDLEHGRVTVQGAPDPEAVRAAIVAEGYAVAE